MTHDIVIIGAGPVGLCLARAFSALSLRVALVERQPLAAIAEPAFDGREIALTHASMRILRQLGVWERIPQEEVSPLRTARVMTGHSPREMIVDAGLAGHDRLGALVPNQRIRQAAWQAVAEAQGVNCLAEARVEALRIDDECAEVALQDGQCLRAPLLIAADSRFSETRRTLGIGAIQQDFGKTMLVCRMQHERSNHGEAWEWFDHGQTLALLPLGEHLSSAVLTVVDAEARALLRMPEDAFAAEMRRRYDGRLGDMQLQGERHAYPLVGVYARRFVGPRFALAGDAAVGMHPVTAHGFNLGLASVERLAELARTAQAQGRDLGDAGLLARYQRRHRAGTWPLYQATRTIVGVFTDDRPPVRLLRAAILGAGQRLLPFRRALASTLADEAPADTSLARRLRTGLAYLRPR